MDARGWMRAACMGAVLVMGVGCGGEPSTYPVDVCERRRWEACRCPYGDLGARRCDDDGQGWGECTGCATSPGPCVGRTCGLGTDGATSCGTCQSPQICYGGICVTDARFPDAGPRDAGPPDSGVRDAGSSAGTCTACTSNAGCPIGSYCGRRYCDGLSGCYRSTSDICTTINALMCPAVGAYHQCTRDEQCGPFSVCIAVWPGIESVRVCAQPCAAMSQCPPAIPGGTGDVYCGLGYCRLGCTGAGTLCDPTGLRCYVPPSGIGSYCAP